MAAFGVSAVAGYAVSTAHKDLTDGLGAAVAGALLWLALRRWGTGLWHGVLLIGAVDGLPGKTLESTSVFHLPLTDWIVLLLIGSLIFDNTASELWRGGGYIRTATYWWAAAFLGLCGVAVIRAFVFQNAPLKGWGNMAFDFVFFGALVPLFSANFSDSKRRDTFIATCGVGAAWIAFTVSASAITHASLSFFVHVTTQEQQQQQGTGLTRVYASAEYLFDVAFPFALGFTLFARRGAVRAAAAVVFALCGIGIALSLVRALYFGAIVGLGVAGVIWSAGGGASAGTARRRLFRSIAVVSATGLAIYIFQPSGSVISPVSGVVNRATQTFTSSQSAENQYRLDEASTLEHVLGSQWLFGMGFNSSYFPGLPSWEGGSIHDTDLGVLNPVMTMGVVGAAVEYLPFIGLALLLIWRRKVGQELDPHETALAFGAVGFAVLAIASSLTLVLIFSATGGPVCAAALGIGFAVAEKTGSASFSRRGWRVLHLPAQPPEGLVS
jgi:hypothetical protein